MKAKIKVIREFDIKTLEVQAHVRYWEDGEVDGVEDTEGKLIPCREGDLWKPVIDIETGQITNWQQGKVAKVHYKVCDAGTYILKDDNGVQVLSVDGYVPSCLSPNDSGYGDYIILEIDENGLIDNFLCDESTIEEDFVSEDLD